MLARAFRCVEGPTIFLPNRRLVDDVVVVDVQVQLEHPQLEVDGINHWDEPIVIAWRAGRPIPTKVGEHIDVLPNKVHNRFANADVKIPLPPIIPLGGGRHRAPNLRCG